MKLCVLKYLIIELVFDAGVEDASLNFQSVKTALEAHLLLNDLCVRQYIGGCILL